MRDVSPVVVPTPRWFEGEGLRHRLLPALLAAVGLVFATAILHVAHLDLLLLLAMPIALALVLPVNATLFVRLVLAIGCCFCINFMVAWLAGFVSVPLLPVTVALALGIPLAIAVATERLRPRVGTLVDWRDGVALGAGLAVLLLLWLPTARDSTAALLGRMTPGEDNSAHLGIVQAIVQQHGLLFGQAQRWNGQLLAGHTAYPPAFHVNVALVVSGLENFLGRRSAEQLVRAYFYLSIGLQAVWATTIVMAIGALGSLRRTSALALAAIAFAAVLFFVFWAPAMLFTYGFQPQVAALWMLTFQLYLAATPDLEDHPMLRFWLTLAAMAGTTWSWYLVSPVAWTAALALAILDRNVLLKRWRVALVGAVLAVVLTLPPLIAGLVAQAPSYINGSGGVYLLDRVVIAVLVLGCLVLAVLPGTWPRQRGRLVTLAALLGAGVVALAIHWYQIHTAGTANYFYEKVLYTIVIVGALGAGAVAFAALSAALEGIGPSSWRRLGAVAATVAVAWLATGILTGINPGRSYLAGTWTASDVRAIQFILDTPAPHDATQVLFWGNEPSARPDYFSSRFAAAFYLLNTDDRNAFMANAAFIQDDIDLRNFIQRSSGKLWLVTSNPQLRDRLVGAGFTDADFQKIILETLPAGAAPAAARIRSFDISARAIFPNLFRTRCTAPPSC